MKRSRPLTQVTISTIDWTYYYSINAWRCRQLFILVISMWQKRKKIIGIKKIKMQNKRHEVKNNHDASFNTFVQLVYFQACNYSLLRRQFYWSLDCSYNLRAVGKVTSEVFVTHDRTWTNQELGFIMGMIIYNLLTVFGNP